MNNMANPKASKVINKAMSYVRDASYGGCNKFTKWYGFGSQSVAWCAIFVYYCMAQVGGKDILSGCSNKAYVPTIWNFGKKKGYKKNKPQKGDMVFFDWNNNNCSDHIGFVLGEMKNGQILTVEGNTSHTSNGNGRCVQVRKRNKSDIMGYMRPKYAKETAKKAFTGTLPTLPKRGYFKEGDSGVQVKRLQNFLNWATNGNIETDGDLGDVTIAYIQLFQVENGLSVDASFGGKSLDAAVKLVEKYADKKVSTATKKPAETPAKPAKVTTYSVGKTYTLQTNMKVRAGAGTKYRQKKRSELTKDGQANSLNKTYAVLKKGTKVTCKKVSNGWMKTPSGWICIKSGDKIYIK